MTKVIRHGDLIRNYDQVLKADQRIRLGHMTKAIRNYDLIRNYDQVLKADQKRKLSHTDLTKVTQKVRLGHKTKVIQKARLGYMAKVTKSKTWSNGHKAT